MQNQQNQQNKWGRNQGDNLTHQASQTSQMKQTNQISQTHKTSQMEIPMPSQKELESYLKAFKTDSKMERYREQESALNKLFKVYPQNNNLSEVFIKVFALNTFYSTKIFNVFAVAEHIIGVKNVDERLQKGDENLVGEIAKSGLKNKKGKEIIFYSFAIKFCFFHNSEKYAIYDSYVAKVLVYFQRKDKFRKQTFYQNDLRDYGKFMRILEDFKNYKRYKLKCDLKSLDLYLWQLGKDKKYEDLWANKSLAKQPK